LGYFAKRGRVSRPRYQLRQPTRSNCLAPGRGLPIAQDEGLAGGCLKPDHVPGSGKQALPIQCHRAGEVVHIPLCYLHDTGTVAIEIQPAFVAVHYAQQRRPLRPPVPVERTPRHPLRHSTPAERLVVVVWDPQSGLTIGLLPDLISSGSPRSGRTRRACSCRSFMALASAGRSIIARTMVASPAKGAEETHVLRDGADASRRKQAAFPHSGRCPSERNPPRITRFSPARS